MSQSNGRQPRIVISYRREDSAGHAGHLYADLRRQFDTFMDIDNIPAGSDFAEVIHEAIAGCDVMIVLIGAGWLTTTDEKGRQRLRKANDFVRLEVEAALASAITVLPVLVQGAEMPSPEDLPPSLRPLAGRNAFEISDRRWDADVRDLVVALGDIVARKGLAVPPQLSHAEPLPDPAPAPPVPSRPTSDRPAVTLRGGRPRWALLAVPLAALTAVVIGVIVLTSGAHDGGEVRGETIVRSAEVWTSTGLKVAPGQTVSITATGTISSSVASPRVSNGPEGLAHLDGFPDTRDFPTNVIRGELHAAMIGRIGDGGTAFLVGAGKTFTAESGGILYLGINDTGVENNEGAFRALVTIRR